MGAPKNFYNTVDQEKLGINKISGIISIIGDDTTGLVKRVDDLEEVVGDNDSGLVKEVNDIVRLPEISESDSGKVLGVDSSGEWLVTDSISEDISAIEAQLAVMQKTLDNITNPPSNIIHSWDFTKSSDWLVDEITGTKLANPNTYISHVNDKGMIFSGDYRCYMSIEDSFNLNDTVIVEFGNMEKASGNYQVHTVGLGSRYTNNSISYNPVSSKWGISIQDQTPSYEFSFGIGKPNFFRNGKIQLKWIDQNTCEMFVNDQFVGNIPWSFSSSILGFGSWDYCFINMTIKSVKIYS